MIVQWHKKIKVFKYNKIILTKNYFYFLNKKLFFIYLHLFDQTKLKQWNCLIENQIIKTNQMIINKLYVVFHNANN